VIEQGGNDFVGKPFRKSEIFNMISKHLLHDRKSYSFPLTFKNVQTIVFIKPYRIYQKPPQQNLPFKRF